MKKILFAFIFLLSLTSCERLFFGKDLASDEPFVNFEYLWNEVDKKYAYFQLKQVDWDLMRNKYRAKLFANMSQDSLFKVLGAMLNELRDDHTNLISPFNVSVYQVDLTGADNYEERTIRENYLKNDMYITGGFIHGFIANRTVGYVRYSSFMNGVSDADLDFILRRYQNAKGLILDLRENGGGSIINVPMILNRFVSQKTLVGYERTRNGAGRNDFSKDEEFYLVPSDNVQYTKPVMVLIDRGSYSATTFFALATKALPNVTLVGDTTGGGGGLPNGGQLPNGWTYRFSITQLLDLNKNNYAEAGVPADIPAQLNLTDRTSDAIIERAILALQ